ncbi:divalent-cation tolerance protein CutA [Gallaecimonas mangrovi]|uniref:divalent-cation tolerance protein CutA n=1 Tax=Gallaecimonas mangrovi TaxID=2291597 RepID=UPI000E2023A6|nr:divalent-cation tolerance protein CutA [Gallaecimonas mangrovi]
MPKALVVLCTCPDNDTATTLSKHLLTEHLAGCINVIPAVRSLYLWQGALCEDSELQLVIKTTAERYAALEAAILKHHPYDTPEIIALAVEKGSADYLNWLAEVTHD